MITLREGTLFLDGTRIVAKTLNYVPDVEPGPPIEVSSFSASFELEVPLNLEAWRVLGLGMEEATRQAQAALASAGQPLKEWGTFGPFDARIYLHGAPFDSIDFSNIFLRLSPPPRPRGTSPRRAARRRHKRALKRLRSHR